MRTVLSSLGPFFEVETANRVDHVGLDAGWRPLATLSDGPALDERVTHVQSFLSRLSGAEVSPRVAASTLSLGLFARMVAPVLGARVLGITLPRPSLSQTLWRPTESGPVPLTLCGPALEPNVEAVLAEVVTPIGAAIGRRYSLSEPILRGNIASGVFGAVTMIGAARPEHHAAALILGTDLLDGPLAGAGAFVSRFVRSSCCLYYQVPGGGYCGDCVLAHPRSGRHQDPNP